MGQYIPSTTDGMTWNVYVHKPQGRPAYAFAAEGEYKENDGGRGFNSFTFMMFQNRTRRVDLIGNNTKKNRELALATLKGMMLHEKLIAEDAPAFTG